MHPYDDPFPPDGQDGTTEPAPAQAAGGDGYRPGPLEAVAGAFRLLVTGPQPLALQAGRLAPGLPDRLVPLDELTVLLLHPERQHRRPQQGLGRAGAPRPVRVPGLDGRADRGGAARPDPRRGQPGRRLPRRSGRPGDRGAGRVPGRAARPGPRRAGQHPAGLPPDLGRVPGRPGAGLLRRRRGQPAAATWTSPAVPRPGRPGTRTSSWPPRSAAASSPPPTRT